MAIDLQLRWFVQEIPLVVLVLLGAILMLIGVAAVSSLDISDSERR